MRIIVLLIFLIYTVGFLGQAQVNAQLEPVSDSISVIGNATKTDIQLRWAPNDHIAWQRLNDYGYSIERITILKNGQLLEEPEKKQLTKQPIKPLPIENWENVIDENDWAAIAAQSLYGEDFNVSVGNSTDILSVINISKEQRQRFSFALFAADQSFEVAQMAGLGFVDSSVVKGEKYVYRLISNVPEEFGAIERGSLYIGLDDYKALPKPYNLQAEFGDRSVILSWEQKNFTGIYNSFIVEKSTDGGRNYYSITDKPIVNSFNEKNNDSRLAFKTDSLAANHKIYYYRVRGKSAFGQISDPSDSVFGKGVLPLNTPPAITKWDAKDNSIRLKWDFPKESNSNINGFYVERGESVKGPFNKIAEVSFNTRSYLDTLPNSTNYYRVVAFNKDNKISSFPILAQIEDSIPPAVPENLKYVISSEGEVYLSWNENNEKDFLGYRIYRSNFKNSEFTEITNTPLTTNTYTDGISVKNLTSNIYYKIRSIDTRYNPSKPSEILIVKKPDFLVPVSPVIAKVRSDNEGIHLNIIPSSSEDVVKHQIYREKVGEENWILLKEIELKKSTTFLDVEIEPKQTYRYKIYAVDNTNLSSPASQIVSVSYDRSIPDLHKFDLDASYDAKLSSIILKFDCEQEIKEVNIYRGENGASPSFYFNQKSNSSEFVDDNIRSDSDYVYAVQLIFSDGLVSRIMTVSI